jgi:alkylation response protein AidB-like acyl-CoA dehydrogenase
MDLQLTADQELFVETTRRFLEAECPLTEVRRLHDDQENGFDTDYWKKAADLGWTAMLVSEADGGGSVSGDGLMDLVLVAEEMGRLVSPGPLVPVNVVADSVARVGTDSQRSELLPGLVSGELIATWAFAEADGTWDAAGVTLEARQDGGDWVLAGEKTFVQDAGVAQCILVSARSGDSLTQFLVPSDTSGLTRTNLGSLDFTRKFSKVVFDGVRVGSDAVLGSPGGAQGDIERQLEVALCLQNAETVGATSRALDFTLDYAKDRMAFGRPIGSYQALKHRLADMTTWMQASHATASASARAVQAGSDDAAELVSIAKSYIGDRCPAIIQDCVQLHGGIGVTWEHDLHLYLRRVAQNAAMYGSVSQHRERLAALIGM